MARIASPMSRKRGFGGAQGTLKRHVLCPLTCVPSPSIAWFLLCLCIAYGLLCHTLHPRTSRMERRTAPRAWHRDLLYPCTEEALSLFVLPALHQTGGT